MSHLLPKNIRDAIAELTKLPGIGPKSAQRLAFYLLKKPDGQVKLLGDAITKIRDNITLCKDCFMLSTEELCLICADTRRAKNIICIVEQSLDVIAIEKTKDFQGIYHVLHGVISPIDGIGPADLKIEPLLTKVRNATEQIEEVILATNPSLEGETTAMYLQKILYQHVRKITRIALGMPVGGELEYADGLTVTRALEGRREYS